MNRLAVFVEGYTEVVFVEKLILEIAGNKQVLIEYREIRGGGRARRTMGLVRALQPVTNQKYYVLIVDCGGDELVKTRVLEEHENLTRKGYSKIIGLRDVRPAFTHAEIPRLEASLPKYVRNSLIPVEFILAIMEIEAWFLAEASHFPRIDSAITVAAIVAALGFNPENDDMAMRATPTDDLKACYALGGKTYQKSNATTTVNAIDYTSLYFHLTQKIAYLSKLVNSIDSFLA
jgi:hypothetical protein